MARYNIRMNRICIVPKVSTGGMASFRLKFEEGLQARGIEVTHNSGKKTDAILVISGTRRLLPLWWAKLLRRRIVQRLDGVNWVQRVRRSGLRYTFRAEYGNRLLAYIRDRVAHQVVYQSEFIRGWWEDWYGVARAPGHVILNGVDLRTYAPRADGTIPRYPPYRILVVEGSLVGGLDTGLKAAVRLVEFLSKQFTVELNIAGKVDERAMTDIKKGSKRFVNFLGLVPHEQIPDLMRSSHLLFSAEINPPCPNSVIEALACGLPVVGFDTGSLYELLGDSAGRLVPYGGDPWKLEPPDVPALAEAAAKILVDQASFRFAARARAEELLSVDKMVDEYLKVLLDSDH